MYQVVMIYPGGVREELDERFETREAAEWEGQEMCNNYATGGEVLHLSNPGDYPEFDDQTDAADFEVIEI